MTIEFYSLKAAVLEKKVVERYYDLKTREKEMEGMSQMRSLV